MKLLLISSLIGFLGCSVYVKPIPTHAEVYVEKPAVTTTLYVETQPPPRRVEYSPAPRSGYVWVDGYWHWSGRTWVWLGGHWEAERVGYVWIAPRYETRQSKSVYVQGRWEAKPGYKTNNSYKATGYQSKPNGYKASDHKNDGYKASDHKKKNDKKKKSKR